jgi:hypothetical protein
MGVRGEIFSTRMILPNRTYFLNVKENRMGDLYLNIVESKNKENGGFERQSVIVFAEDLPLFLGEFDKALKMLEKAKREPKRPERESRSRPADRESESAGREGPEGRPRRDSGERRGSGEKSERPRTPREERPRKRVVVTTRDGPKE